MLSELTSLSAFWKRYPLLGSGDRLFPARRYKRYRDALRVKRKILPGGLRHLGSLLHDCWVRAVDLSDTHVALTLNDFSCHCLCEALVQVQGLEIPESLRVMPVTLRFEDVAHFAFYRLSFDKIVAHSLRDDCDQLSEFLYDEAITIERGRVAFGLILWAEQGKQPKRRKVWGERLLEIEAGRLIIEEGQRDAFIGLVGTQYAALFDEFMRERDQGCSRDFTGALEFLRLKGLVPDH